MQTPEQLWNHGEWMIRAMLAKKIAQDSNSLERLLNKELYSISDYEIREKEDHFESYNIHTGEALYEAESRDEAYRDLLEEFGA